MLKQLCTRVKYHYDVLSLYYTYVSVKVRYNVGSMSLYRKDFLKTYKRMTSH